MKPYLFSAILLGLVSCSGNETSEEIRAHSNQKNEKTEMESMSENQTLKSILDEKKNNFEEKADANTKSVYKDGIDDVRNSGVLQNAKQIGQTAPNFSLKNALGENVELSNYLEKGPVVLTWYRGGWCPYCNLTLHALQEELPSFEANGAQLIALTPELPDNSMSTAEKQALKFQVLSDVGNEVAKQYGIVFELTPEVAEIYNQKFDLEAYNGDTSNELPLAATYVINQDGQIVYSFLDADYRNRAEPSEITNILKNL